MHRVLRVQSDKAAPGLHTSHHLRILCLHQACLVTVSVLFHAEKSDTAAKLRGLGFYMWTILLAIPLFVTMLVMAPLVLMFDKVR